MQKNLFVLFYFKKEKNNNNNNTSLEWDEELSVLWFLSCGANSLSVSLTPSLL